MKKILFLVLTLCLQQISFSQNITDSGIYLPHKFEQRIGKEKYIVTKNDSTTNYAVDFKYVDRGSPVNLTGGFQK